MGCGAYPKLLLDVSHHIKYGIGIDKNIEPGCQKNLLFKKEHINGTINLPDKSIDIVTALAFLEHLEYPEKIIPDVNRILKKNGLLIVTIPSRYNKPIGEFLSLKLKLIDPEAYRDHKHYYTKDHWERIIGNSGFRVIRSHYWELMLNIFILAKKA